MKNWIHAFLAEIGIKKCPFAADKNTNPNRLSHKYLELSQLLQYNKSEYQKWIKELYSLIKPCLWPNKDINSMIQEWNQLIDAKSINNVNRLYDGNKEVTGQIIAWLGHAIRNIISIRDVYIELWWSDNNIKNWIKKIIYQLATIWLYDLPLSWLKLKINTDLHIPIKNIPYDKNKFFIDENNILQFQQGIMEDILWKWRCPAIWSKVQEEDIPIIDDMIDKLVW